MKSSSFINNLAPFILLTAHSSLALPQASTAVSQSQTIFQRWSSHPDCAAPDTACKSDCTQAVKNICAESLDLNGNINTNYLSETVGECTVTYIYELGNTIPDSTKCYNTYAYINDAGKPGADGCGGYFGGVLGWDDKGNRTSDPIYAIQPKSGNPNCFMPPGKEAAKPLAMDELPGGITVPAADCPTAVSRRGLGGTKECTIGTSVWFGSCSVTCMAVVASASAWWTFGVGLAVAPALCLGPCGGLAWGVDAVCEKLEGEHPAIKPRLLLGARAADPEPDPCAGTESAAIACPALRNSLLKLQGCAGADGSTGLQPSIGGGVINT